MKVKLSNPILNFEGEPIQQNGEVVTYGNIIRNVLGAPSDKDNGEKKLKKFDLGLKCVADEVELDLDERKFIKDLVDEFGLNPIIYGRICNLFENGESE